MFKKKKRKESLLTIEKWYWKTILWLLYGRKRARSQNWWDDFSFSIRWSEIFRDLSYVENSFFSHMCLPKFPSTNAVPNENHFLTKLGVIYRLTAPSGFRTDVRIVYYIPIGKEKKSLFTNPSVGRRSFKTIGIKNERSSANGSVRFSKPSIDIFDHDETKHRPKHERRSSLCCEKTHLFVLFGSVFWHVVIILRSRCPWYRMPERFRMKSRRKNRHCESNLMKVRFMISHLERMIRNCII